MSRYPPEADEAQHRHYNDGHFANPYDAYDPFNPPVQVPTYPPPPVLTTPPANQPYHPFASYPSQSPPPPPPPSVGTPFAGPSAFSSPGPSVNYASQPQDLRPSSPSLPYLSSMYDAHEDHDQDNGNIPLLNR